MSTSRKALFASAVFITMGSAFARADSKRNELGFMMGAQDTNATLDLGAFGGGSERIGNGGFAFGGRYFHQLRRLPALGVGFDLLSADLGQNESFDVLPNFDTTTSLHSTQGLVMFRLILPSGVFRPYLIAGGGLHATSLKLESQPVPGFVWTDTRTTETRTLYDSGKGSWAAAWGLGFNWQLNDIINLGIEGRIGRSGSVTFAPTAQGQALGLGDIRGSFTTRAILGHAGVSF
jgi:hypothetical protein